MHLEPEMQHDETCTTSKKRDASHQKEDAQQDTRLEPEMQQAGRDAHHEQEA